MVEKIAVLGAGNVGYAMAADLSLRGYEVSLYEMPEFRHNIEPVLKRGGIELTKVHAPPEHAPRETGFARLSKITTDIKNAIEGVRYIMVTTVSLAHGRIAELCAPYIEDDQVMVLWPGTAGSLEVAKVFRDKRVEKEVVIGETVIPPFTCRIVDREKAIVNAHFSTVNNFVAAFPAKYNKKLIRDMTDMFRPMKLTELSNVIVAGLGNSNTIDHPPMMVLNAGRIEYAKGEFHVMVEGYTECVWKVIDALDRERISILEELGLEAIPYQEFMRIQGYEMPKPNGSNGEYAEVVRVDKRPLIGGLKNRRITEDVPMGLVFMSSLGDMIGVPTSTTKALIRLASIISGTDYMKKGRTVEKLGICGLRIKELVDFLFDGYPLP